ncbi:hypothetical protein ABZ695_04925 [Streptomyces sp. NPDC006976]|uniref:hypothetical protein n=1 Tax=Streptomyces sp. NPDC006976 TaxID=3154311 RepID=UPI0033E8E432
MPAAVDARVEQIVRRTRRTHRANLPRRVPLKLLEGRGETPYDAPWTGGPDGAAPAPGGARCGGSPSSG